MKTKVEFSMAWFKSHAFLLGALAFIEVFSIGFFFVFNWLNSEVGYYLFLQAFFLLVIVGALLWHDWRKYREVVRSLQQEVTTLDDGFSPVVSHLYEAIQQEKSDMRGLSTKMKQLRKEDVDYYTLWAHQIKTSIAASQLLIRELPQTSEKSLLSQELIRITTYTELALHYVRMESFHQDLSIATISIDEVIRPLLKKYATFFISKKLHLDYVPTEKKVVTDSKWLGVIVEQVLSNAVKYTPEDGTIRILFEEDTLTIEDTGIGIAAYDIKRIFERGFSGYNGRVNHQSTGLGLYLSAEIAKRLGVTLSVESTVGEGTTVHIQIPSEVMQVKD